MWMWLLNSLFIVLNEVGIIYNSSNCKYCVVFLQLNLIRATHHPLCPKDYCFLIQNYLSSNLPYITTTLFLLPGDPFFGKKLKNDVDSTSVLSLSGQNCRFVCRLSLLRRNLGVLHLFRSIAYLNQYSERRHWFAQIAFKTKFRYY